MGECVIRAEDRDRLTARMGYLYGLKQGWLDPRDGTGDPIAFSLLIHVERAVELLMKNGVPFPSIYPTLHGGVQIEWVEGSWVTDCTWSRVGDAYIHTCDVRDNRDDSRVLDSELRGAAPRVIASQIQEVLARTRTT